MSVGAKQLTHKEKINRQIDKQIKRQKGGLPKKEEKFCNI